MQSKKSGKNEPVINDIGNKKKIIENNKLEFKYLNFYLID